MHLLKEGQKFQAWVDPPLIRAMPERKRFFPLTPSLNQITDQGVQTDFILNYFLSNSPFSPSPDGRLEQLMSPGGGDDVYVISPQKSESFPKDMGGGVAIF